MTTDGGGWTLILNYLHLANTSVYPYVRTSNLPLRGQTTPGIDESNVDGGIYWGHAGNTLLSALTFSQVRLYCIASDHPRILHFSTSLGTVISYLKTGTGSFAGIQNPGNYQLFVDHNAFLPTMANSFWTNQGDNALTASPMVQSVGMDRHWNMQTQHGLWSCDNVGNLTTYHQVFIR